jgi:hypothetical protein
MVPHKKISKLLYKLDTFQIVIVIFSSFLLGFCLAYWIWGVSFNNFYRKLWNSILSFTPENALEFLSISAGLLGAIVGIAIPISLSIVSENLKVYKDVWISEQFRKEWEYKYQFTIVIPTIIFTLLLTFFNWTHPLLLFISLLLIIFSIFLFYKFLRLMEKYSTQSEEVIFQKTKRQIDEILE